MRLITDGTQHSRFISTPCTRLFAWKFAAGQLDMSGKSTKVEARLERMLNEVGRAALYAMMVCGSYIF